MTRRRPPSPAQPRSSKRRPPSPILADVRQGLGGIAGGRFTNDKTPGQS